MNDLLFCLEGQENINQEGNRVSELARQSFSGFSYNSRYVKAGDAFIVIPCEQAEAYARAALEAGAVALIAEKSLERKLRNSLKAPLIVVKSARHAVSQAAVMLYPRQPQTNIAVTGTNGKSSVVSYVRQIWEKLGLRGASIGTMGVELTARTDSALLSDLPSSKLTTPDAFSLHQILDKLAASSVTHCVFEASSHGLEQYRTHGVKLTAGGFTNLSQDHLDYHKTMESYFAAKVRLFTEILPPHQIAVLNKTSSCFPVLKTLGLKRGQKILTYGIGLQEEKQEADVFAENIRFSISQMHVDIIIHGKKWSDVPLSMVGIAQVENLLCAVALTLAGGASVSSIMQVLPHLHMVSGRMELVGQTSRNGAIFVDYSHKPVALSRALETLRYFVRPSGKLIVVFGCGGNRDAGKRIQMGEIAQRMADQVYVTDDNPRHEDPGFIRSQILAGCPKAQEIGDRRQAIATAIHHMDVGDILLIAGKGDEQGQIIGDQVIPFDDRMVVKFYLKESLDSILGKR